MVHIARPHPRKRLFRLPSRLGNPGAIFGNIVKATSPPAAEWAQLWAHGFPTEVFSQDFPAFVDSWYSEHLKNYARRSNGSHARYSGAGGSVGILSTAGTRLAPYGNTVIVLEPKEITGR